MLDSSDTWVLPQNRQPVKRYLPRALLVIGGVLAMLSTVLPWVSIPVVGGLNLWRLYSIGSKVTEVTGDSDGGAFISTALLLWAVAILVLGAGAIVWGVLARTRRGVRLAAGVPGGALLAMGLAAVILVATEVEEPVGLGAGEILLLVAGLLAFAGVFIPAPTPTPTRSTGWHAALTQSGRGEIVGRAVAFVGIGCLVASLTLFVVGGAQASSDTQGSGGAAGLDRLGRDSDPPDGASPWDDDTPESSQRSKSTSPSESPGSSGSSGSSTSSGRSEEAADPDPPDVVDDYYEAINGADYEAAWDIGGKNLNDSYAEFAQGYEDTEDVVWTTEDVAGERVTGSLLSEEADGSVKTFEGTYTVHDGEIVNADIQLVN